MAEGGRDGETHRFTNVLLRDEKLSAQVIRGDHGMIQDGQRPDSREDKVLRDLVPQCPAGDEQDVRGADSVEQDDPLVYSNEPDSRLWPLADFSCAFMPQRRIWRSYSAISSGSRLVLGSCDIDAHLPSDIPRLWGSVGASTLDPFVACSSDAMMYQYLSSLVVITSSTARIAGVDGNGYGRNGERTDDEDSSD